MLTRTRVLLPSLPALRREADRGRLVLLVAGGPVGHTRLVDRPMRRPPQHRRGEPQYRGGATDPGVTTPSGHHGGDGTVRVRRRLRPGPAVRRAVRCGCTGGGAYQKRPQV